MWDRNTPPITTSLRGIVYEEVIVRCADRDLHSGLFGGAAQNPIRVLVQDHRRPARRRRPHHACRASTTACRRRPTQVLEQWRKLDLTPEEFLGQVGLKIPAGEKGRMLIEQIQSRPTCDVNGIIGGYTGVGAKTVIAGRGERQDLVPPRRRPGPAEDLEQPSRRSCGSASRPIARSSS